MSTTPTSTATARRAQMLRQAWQPVGQRLSTGAGGMIDFLAAHPSLAQGVYYVLTGLWPWAHRGSFEAITGPKTDFWLVETVGALIAVIGATLCLAAYLREKTPPVLCLALGSAGALFLVDVLFVFQGRIALVYLGDAILEAGIVGLWVYGWRLGRWQVEKPASRAPVAHALPESYAPGQPPPR